VTIESHPSFAVVMDDVITGLGGGFSPRWDPADRDSFVVSKHFKEEDVIGSESVVAVPWTYYAAHTGDFECLFRTGREVTIEGMTFVDTRRDETVLHRYVDWIGVVTQLGLEVSWRIPVTEDEYAYGRDDATAG
jgi:hypothetical protein